MSRRAVVGMGMGLALIVGSAGAAKPAGAEEAFACAGRAAATFEVDVLLLWAIKRVESGRALTGRIELVNKDGSTDRGPMQINSQWIPRIEAMGIPMHDGERLHDWCTNFTIGAWLLSHSIQQYGLAEGVARYHSPTAWRGAAYVRRVLDQFDAMAIPAAAPARVVSEVR